MTGTLLPLLVVVPLVGAALGTLVPGGIGRVMLVLSPALTTAGGVALLVTHQDTPVLAQNVGAFVPGVAIPLVSDTFSAVLITVTGVAGARTLTYAQ